MSTNKNIPYSVLELASVAVNKTPHDVFKNSLDLAQQAEAFGYSRFWLAEHHNMISIASSATSVLIGHIAGEQKRFGWALEESCCLIIRH
jgi:alkanesulfonate monooxygenase SsuD/methylene tetrahydromethanopterin reductase-like flavin-dependent oxidoreductase (luciferase family)